VLLELFLGVDLADEVVPDLHRRLRLAQQQRAHFARDVAIGADRPHAAVVGVVDRADVLGVHVVLHLVAADAEGLRARPGETGSTADEEHRAGEHADEAQAEQGFPAEATFLRHVDRRPLIMRDDGSRNARCWRVAGYWDRIQPIRFLISASLPLMAVCSSFWP